MTVLEAMACGTPVLTSNVSALPEVVGEGGALVNPYDTAAISEKLAELLEDQSERDDLSRRGLERARRFTWPQVAEQTVRVYREILSSSRALPNGEAPAESA